jgi:hypothetical protein
LSVGIVYGDALPVPRALTPRLFRKAGRGGSTTPGRGSEHEDAAKDKLAAALILAVLVALVALGLAAREAEWWQYAFAAAMLLLAGLVSVEARRIRNEMDGDRREGGEGDRQSHDGDGANEEKLSTSWFRLGHPGPASHGAPGVWLCLRYRAERLRGAVCRSNGTSFRKQI